MHLYYNASQIYKPPTPPATGGNSNMIYANYACAQKSLPNGTKNRKKKRTRGRTGRKRDTGKTKLD